MSISSQREDFLATIKNFTAQHVQDYKSQLSSLFPSGSPLFESEQDKSNFLKSFLRNLRIFLEQQMEKTTKEGTVFYNTDTNEILRFIFWAAKSGYIEPINAFVIMEDIYDCLSMGEISIFFQFLEELIQLFDTFASGQQQALLRIGNSILKKFSKVHNNDFRGRVQLFLAKITSLCEKTAVNLKSNINLANQTIAASSMIEEENIISKQFKNEDFHELSNLRMSFGSYRKFWELQKFLQNPQLLFSDEASIIVEDDESLEGKPAESETSMEIESVGGTEVKKKAAEKGTKVGAFCVFVSDIIEIFRKDPLPETQDIFRQKNYPKYLTKYSLLNIQLKDPNFRKSWLMQVNSCLWCLKNPLKITQKKGFVMSESDQEKLRNLEKKVSEYIPEIPSVGLGERRLDNTLDFFLEREGNWCQWKENGCPPFDKPVPAQVTEKFSKLKDQKNLVSSLFKTENGMLVPNPKARQLDNWNKTIRETSDKFMKDVLFDKDNQIFSYLQKPTLQASVDALEPGVGYYFHSFLSEMKDPTLQEEDKLASDMLSVWRGLRTLTRNCINLFNISKSEAVEMKLDDILKKILKDSGNPVDKPEAESQDDKKKKETKTPTEGEMKEEKKDGELKTAGSQEMKEEKPVEKQAEKPEEKKPEEKKVEEKKPEEKKPEERKPEEKRIIEKPTKELTTNRGENRDERVKEKITERIVPKSSEDKSKSSEKIIHTSMNKKRSPEDDLREHERQATQAKKTKQ